MIDKKEFLRDLKTIKKNCISQQNYNPADDIVYLVTKYNIDVDQLWKKIKELLTLH